MIRDNGHCLFLYLRDRSRKFARVAELVRQSETKKSDSPKHAAREPSSEDAYEP
jgi:hypothetical protein